MSLRKSLALVATATLIGMFTAGVGTSAAADPPEGASFTVDPSTVEAGGDLTVSGSQCGLVVEVEGPWLPGSVVITVVDSAGQGASRGSAVADGNGDWSTVLPAPEEAGTYTVDVSCDVYDESFDYPEHPTVTVTAAPTSSSETPTPTPTTTPTSTSTPTTTTPLPPTAVIGDVTRDGCRVSIPVTTTGEGPFTLSVWDDSEVVQDVDWNPATAETETVVTWVISEPALEEQAPGVGFYVTVSSGDGAFLAILDPYSYPASAADACAEAGSMSVAIVGYTGSVAPGGTVDIVASGFYPDEKVEVVLHSDPVQLATLTADANGTVSGSLVIPDTTPLGAHTLVLTGLTSLLSTQIAILVASSAPTTTATVVPPPTVVPATPVLAATGVDSTGMSLWGFGLLLVGGVFVALAGRRRVAGEHRSSRE